VTVLAEFALGDLILSIAWFFLLFLWLWLLITVFADVFRSDDLSGIAKALWVIFVILVPFLGVLIYLIVRGGRMQQHALRAQKEAQQSFDEYVRRTAGGGSVASELERLHDLKQRGVLSEDEYDRLKAKTLGS
jgi:ABC-type multidrug transport system fused ATPase/permease subunit